MSDFLFVPATKEGAFARIALIGPPGSGKTWTALTIAQAFGGTIGVIDTERGSAAKYSDVFGFRHLRMNDFNPAALTSAVAAAAEQDINTLTIDSWSHFWEGAGGMLEQVDRATARAGRSDKFGSGWKEMRPVERTMVDAIISYPGHVIITLRTKVEYVVERNATTGREGPKRIGLKPVQRDGVEYEFDLVGDMDDATLTVTKSRCPELTAAVITKPTEELGFTIARWLAADAVGEPLNPITVRDWAMESDRTVDELHAKFVELDAAGQTGAAVNAPNGKTWALGEFVQACERALRKRLAGPAASELGTALTGAVAA